MGSWFLETQRVKVTEIIQVKSTSMKIEHPENRREKSVFAQSKAAISMSRISFIMLTTNECFKCIPRSVLELLMEN